MNSGYVYGQTQERKLTADQCVSIFDQLISGRIGRAIARDFGVSPSCIHALRSGRTYRHIQRPPGFTAKVRKYRKNGSS